METINLNEAESIVHLYELLPSDCIEECGQVYFGDVYNLIGKWREELNLNIPREQCIRDLGEYGDWEDLETETDLELNIKYLWLATTFEG